MYYDVVLNTFSSNIVLVLYCLGRYSSTCAHMLSGVQRKLTGYWKYF